MNRNHSILGKISLSAGLAIGVAFAAWLSSASRAAAPMDEAQNQMHMQHITTQAQAEALKPGDSMSMTCSKCKDVMIQRVTADSSAHVKMMTVGQTVMCSGCGGTVEVVATGKGEGKNAEVKHVCSKCGDNAMFCSATKPGTGSIKDMNKMKKQDRVPHQGANHKQ